MEVVATRQINSFAPIAAQIDFPVSPQITVPAPVLQDLLDTVQELKEEIAQLRDERAQDRVEFDRFKATHRTFAVQTGKDLDALFDAAEKATTTPETTKKPAQKTQDNITRIAVILAAKEKRLIEGQAPRSYVDRLRKEGATFSELANVMGLTVDRIRQLSRIAATDQRFNITWHPRKKNTKIIKLRRWDALVL